MLEHHHELLCEGLDLVAVCRRNCLTNDTVVGLDCERHVLREFFPEGLNALNGCADYRHFPSRGFGVLGRQKIVIGHTAVGRILGGDGEVGVRNRRTSSLGNGRGSRR